MVADTNRNTNPISKANLAFAGATRLNTQYLMAKSNKLVQNIQISLQEIDQLREIAQNVAFTHVYLEEKRETILGEISTLGETMWCLYEELTTIHNTIVHLHGLQQKSKEFFNTLKNVQDAIIVVKEWIIRHKGAVLNLVKKMKLQAELEKEIVQILIQNNKQLTSFIGNIQASYVWLYIILDPMVRMHKIP